MLLGNVHIQLDNTCRENKNKYICHWLLCLASIPWAMQEHTNWIPPCRVRKYRSLLTHAKCDHCVELYEIAF